MDKFYEDLSALVLRLVDCNVFLHAVFYALPHIIFFCIVYVTFYADLSRKRHTGFVYAGFFQNRILVSFMQISFKNRIVISFMQISFKNRIMISFMQISFKTAY